MTAGNDIRAAWDALARSYDQFTGYHDHPAWAAQLDALARAAGPTGRHVLDVGCGTGESTAALLGLGYDVVGVDVSPGVLELARAKLGPDVALHRHDMRELPELGAFDIVWSAGDVLNFLLDERDLVAALRGFARNLAPGGLAVFDVDTLAGFRAFYTSLLVFPRAERVVIFDGRGAGELAPGAIAEADVDRLEPASTPPWWRRVRTVHRQRHHPQATVERALAAAGLAPLAVWGTDGAGGSQQPLDELRHLKAVYIAQATAPEPTERR